ncbi:saccharopine dehydrogenase NADP-binding domain-containing protein [Salipiger mangrovisoli]|uniref:Saccharopine dehydrogenase NADP-binding domain-containing protein n=1 Tax=Salipiger mangrovisoli TaxID=2865933 RepID=A0ABR9XBN6_9RHOB|nr:saccharopine dehydrogenase NADP-binding domain-containing protein [Salipiger mangrovisoli]MBE9640796.1 saccharopine dehydrogenase NADP-binding domain-containing protein [Salipiger mangrovisoli]
MSFDVMITGAGAVGAHAVEYLARRPEITRICLIDRDGPRAEGIAWRATLGALQEGRHVRIEAHGLDLGDSAALAEVIARTRPRALFHAATMISVPEMARGLPPEVFERIRSAGMGGFLAAHLALGLSVQKALGLAGHSCSLITAPFPDFANQVLTRTAGVSGGPKPLTGIGNVDNMAAELQAMVAQHMGVSALSVRPMIMAHHSVAEWFQRSGNAGAAPWLARVLVEGCDVTDTLDLNALMAESARRIRQVPQESRTAASGVKTVLAALRDDGSYQHGAGPDGKPGGWPIRVWADRVEVLPVPGLDPQAALDTAHAGQLKGGIAEIKDDGTLIATDICAAAVREEFGVDVARLSPGDIPQAAAALRAALSRRIAA